MKNGGESIFWALAFEFAPAAIFGAAVGFATATWLALPPLGTTPAAAGAAAFGAVWLGLNRFGSRGKAFPIADFEQQEIEVELSAVGELLEEADVVALVEHLGASSAKPAGEELVLDDVLAAMEPESRVVRLFDANHTAGEMQARIDRHLRSSPRQIPPDATQELHDALAALRRSLR
jgi:hypothetical protein